MSPKVQLSSSLHDEVRGWGDRVGRGYEVAVVVKVAPVPKQHSIGDVA